MTATPAGPPGGGSDRRGTGRPARPRATPALLSAAVVVIAVLARLLLVPEGFERQAMAVVQVLVLAHLEVCRRIIRDTDRDGWGRLVAGLEIWAAGIAIAPLLPPPFDRVAAWTGVLLGLPLALGYLLQVVEVRRASLEDAADAVAVALVHGLITYLACDAAGLDTGRSLAFAGTMLAVGLVVGVVVTATRSTSPHLALVRMGIGIGVDLAALSIVGFRLTAPGAATGTTLVWSSLAALGLTTIGLCLVVGVATRGQRSRAQALEWIWPLLLGATAAGALGVAALSGLVAADRTAAIGLTALLAVMIPRAASVFVGREDAVLQAESERSRLEAMLGSLSGVVYVLDRDGEVRWRSRATGGTTPVGGRLVDDAHPDHRAVLEDALDEVVAQGHGARVVAEGRPGAAALADRWLEATLQNHLGDPSVAGILVMTRDVTERHRDGERMKRMARIDQLTQLVNRGTFRDELAARLRRPGGVAVLFCDLDSFKVVNDSLGHHVGDRMLVDVGARFEAVMGPGDLLGRLGGDEFAVLTRPEVAHQRARAMIDSLAAPFRIDAHVLPLSASIGIARAVEDDPDPDALIRDADAAMYRAKAQGRGGLAEFDRSMHEAAFEQMALTADLEIAVEEGQFEVHLQPIVRTATAINGEPGTAAAFEALLRWRHPVRGLLDPQRFVAAAEQGGLIGRVGGQVLERACEALVELRAVASDVRMAVNVSPLQLLDPGFPAAALRVVERHGLPPSALLLEVTEGTVIDYESAAISTLRELDVCGFPLALDDFGTGYSALGYLGRLPWSGLKIDRSFVADVVHDPSRRAVVRGIIEIASSLDMAVVAEGVETDAQRRVLEDLGCPLLQGYLFGEPLPLSSLLVGRGGPE